MTDLQAFALGLLLVVGAGLILTSQAFRIRRQNVAARIRARYLATRKVQGLYLEADRDIARFTGRRTAERTHDCSFAQPCDVTRRETERQAAQDRLR